MRREIADAASPIPPSPPRSGWVHCFCYRNNNTRRCNSGCTNAHGGSHVCAFERKRKRERDIEAECEKDGMRGGEREKAHHKYERSRVMHTWRRGHMCECMCEL